MSRVGKHPVEVPSGVEVAVSGQLVSAKGKLGSLEYRATDDVSITLEDNKVTVRPSNDSQRARAMWGTARSRVQNLVTGVSDGFVRDLDINGVGYRAAVEGKDLVLQLGYSHDIRYPIPDDIEIKCERPTTIKISGPDKQKVGQIASEIRGYRKPEPYKGKGVKYREETVLRKEGKKK